MFHSVGQHQWAATDPQSLIEFGSVKHQRRIRREQRQPFTDLRHNAGHRESGVRAGSRR